MGNRRAKRYEIWDLGVLAEHVLDTLPCGVSCHFWVIRRARDFSENTIFKLLSLLHLWFFSVKLFVGLPPPESTQKLLLGILKLKRNLKFEIVASGKNETFQISLKWLIVERKGLKFRTRGSAYGKSYYGPNDGDITYPVNQKRLTVERNKIGFWDRLVTLIW